mmetsp:Transcript_16432/g.27120  ORF Transcript_16432/g.27120 Transcript_16432/m.27120 type:complete len:305 (-) Transcript_16432:382-1296(-)
MDEQLIKSQQCLTALHAVPTIPVLPAVDGVPVVANLMNRDDSDQDFVVRTAFLMCNEARSSATSIVQGLSSHMGVAVNSVEPLSRYSKKLQVDNPLRLFRDAWGLSLSADGTLVAMERKRGERDHVIQIWDTRSGHLLHTLDAHSDEIGAISITEDGKLMASASDDRTLRLWASGSVTRELGNRECKIYDVQFSRDGRRLVSGSDAGVVNIWETSTGRLIKDLRGHTSAIFSVSVIGGWHSGCIRECRYVRACMGYIKRRGLQRAAGPYGQKSLTNNVKRWVHSCIGGWGHDHSDMGCQKWSVD